MRAFSAFLVTFVCLACAVIVLLHGADGSLLVGAALLIGAPAMGVIDWCANEHLDR